MIRSDLAVASARHTGEKMTKEQAGYKRGAKAHHCGICKHYSHHSCDIVEGKIFPAMGCNYFEKAK